MNKIKINKNKKHLHKTWVIRSVAITQFYIPVGKNVSPVTYFRKLVCWDRKTHSIIWRAGAFILKIKTRTDPRILSKRPRWSAHRVYQTLWSNRCNTTAPPGSRGSTQNNVKASYQYQQHVRLRLDHQRISRYFAWPLCHVQSPPNQQIATYTR